MSDPHANKPTAPSKASSADRSQPAAQWFCRLFGTELGPLSFETLCGMIKSQQVGPDDQVRPSDACYWQPARQVTALECLFAAPAPAPAPAAAPPSTVDAGKISSGTTGQATSASPLPDQWFYRLDDREHGPFKLTALQELIGSSGQTAEQVVVRRAGSNEWVSFYQLPDNSDLARAHDGRFGRGPTGRTVTVPAGPSEAPGPLQKVAVPLAPRTLRQFVNDNRGILIAVGVWGLLNVGVLVAWSDPYATERKYFATLRGLEDEVHSLQSRSASPEEWNALRLKAKEKVAPIVADLKKTASASQPIRQHLLWAARDQMPKIIRPDREEKEVDRLYKSHMQLVERQLGSP